MHAAQYVFARAQRDERSECTWSAVRRGGVGTEEMVSQRSVQQYPMGGALR